MLKKMWIKLQIAVLKLIKCLLIEVKTSLEKKMPINRYTIDLCMRLLVRLVQYRILLNSDNSYNEFSKLFQVQYFHIYKFG